MNTYRLLHIDPECAQVLLRIKAGQFCGECTDGVKCRVQRAILAFSHQRQLAVGPPVERTELARFLVCPVGEKYLLMHMEHVRKEDD